jgi:O-antigen/teichoic acid export membrane protein
MFKPGNLAIAGGINLFFLIGNSLVFLIITPLTLNNMGAADYGIWMILLAFSQLAGLATFGTGSAVEKFVAQSSNENQSHEFSACVSFSYLFLLILGCIVAFTIWNLRFLIAGLIRTEDIISIEIIAGAVAWMAFGLLPLFLLQVSKGIFLGLIKNFWAGLIEFIQTSVMWMGVFIITLSSTDFVLLSRWFFGLNVFCLLLSLLVLSGILHKHGFHPTVNSGLSRAMLRQSFLTWFSSLGISLFQNVDRIIVGHIIGPGAAGVYSLATSVALRLNILLGQFTQVLTPIASRWQADGQNEKIVIVFHKFLRFSGWFLFFSAGILVVWMPFILNVWINPEFSNANNIYFQVLVVIYSLFSLARPAHQILNGIGLVEKPANVILFSGIAALGAIAIGASRFGLIGAVGGNLFFCGILALNVILSRHFKINNWDWIKELITPVIAVSALLIFNLIFPRNLPFSAMMTFVLAVLLLLHVFRNKTLASNFRQLYDPDV